MEKNKDIGKRVENLKDILSKSQEQICSLYVVMSQGIKRLEKKIRDDKTIAKAIAKLRGALTRNSEEKYLFT